MLKTKDYKKLVVSKKQKEDAELKSCYKKLVAEITEEQRSQLIDQVSVKRGAVWSFLANRVVGSEQF